MSASRTIDVDILWRLQRIGNPALAPDGAHAVCAVTSYSMQDNRGSTSLWLLPTDPRAPRRLTRCGDKDGQPAWSPHGDRIAFIAKREQQGQKDSTAQLYLIDAAGGEAERASDFGPGIEAFKWMPDGRRVLFVAWVWPELKGSKAQNRQHKAFGERKDSAYVTGQAQYRYFDHNLPMGRMPHLLLLDLKSGGIRDLFEGSGYELPLEAPGSTHFDIAPDGSRIAFVHDPAPRKLASNPTALAELNLATGRFEALSADADWNYDAPRYSPDGTALACVAAHVGRRHTMPGRPALRRRGQPWRMLAEGRDFEVDAPLRWSADGSRLLFTAEDRGRRPLWQLTLHDDTCTVVVPGGWVQGFDLAGAAGGETLVVAADSARHPVQVQAQRSGGTPLRLERFNDALLAGLTLGETQQVSLRGALGDEVQMWLTFPPGFDARHKHPLLHVVHGGPHAAAGDTFGYRWNTQLLASRGHVVAAVNYHGSSGFGFAFRDSIMGRQGELELQDIEAGTDWLLAQPWADAQRVFLSGGSYGGFMAAWLNGHVAAGRYRAQVCHAGVFDRIATFSADSYLHRPRDLGALYWEDPARVAAQNPCNFARHMNTPTLVMHGARDYRVPDCNGLAYYNTLQARGVPARLVWFPDENHWVLKPCNSRLWYQEFFDWLAAHDPGPSSAP